MLHWLARGAFAATRARSDVEALLRADPGGWAVNDCWAEHGGAGIKIWLSCPEYLKIHRGLDVWRPCWSERRLIWRAVADLKAAASERTRRRVANAVAKALREAEARDDAAAV